MIGYFAFYLQFIYFLAQCFTYTPRVAMDWLFCRLGPNGYVLVGEKWIVNRHGSAEDIEEDVGQLC